MPGENALSGQLEEQLDFLPEDLLALRPELTFQLLAFHKKRVFCFLINTKQSRSEMKLV